MEKSPPMIRLRLTIRGRVQGVGFRWFAREAAQGVGVSGWVRNRPGGDVEAEIQGKREALSRLIAALKTGHPHARIDSIQSREIPLETGSAGFDIH